MKKIVLFSLIACLGVVCDSFAKCKLTSCEKGGSKGEGWTLLNTEGERAHEFNGGQCYRCNWGDNEHECGEGTFVAIKHPTNYTTGEIKALFKCVDSKGYNDDWIEANPVNSCGATVSYNFSKLNNRGDNWLYNSDKNASKHYVADGVATNVIQSGDNAVSVSGNMGCVAYLCKKGYHADSTHTRCIEGECDGGCDDGNIDPKPVSETCAGGFQLGGLMDTKDCASVNVADTDLKTGKECKKVCLKNTGTGEVKGMWYISKCPQGMTGVEANYAVIYPHLNHMFEKCMKGNVVGPVKKCDVWKNNPEAFACCNAGLTWNDADKKCEGCPDGKEWNWDAKQKKGECVDKGDDVDPGVVPNGTCQYLFQANVKCANGNTYDVKKYVPVSNTTGQRCEDFLKIYTPDREAVLKIEQEICENPGGYVVISYGPTQAQVNEARNKISSFFNTAESDASVWKDAEGKFNTARLASDLTAGVVLGTVGGVVSGVVIKKKQVEKGFEALHCTVGGQPIADWGDTFNVGLR